MKRFNLPALENLFRKNANPENAFFMKKYMKDKFEFLGIKSPERRIVTRNFFTTHSRPDKHDLEYVLKELWGYKEREFQYFAMELVEKFIKKFEPGDIELLEFMIVNKSWWDTVDFIAVNLVGEYFSNFPGLIGQ